MQHSFFAKPDVLAAVDVGLLERQAGVAIIQLLDDPIGEEGSGRVAVHHDHVGQEVGAEHAHLALQLEGAGALAGGAADGLQGREPQVLDEDKMQIFAQELNWMHFQDCVLNCQFYAYEYHHLAEALSGVTGVEYSIHDVLAVGARAQTLARLFNLREGLTADDDKLPKRVMKAFKSGPIADVDISPEAFEWAKHRYYELMNWDAETGAPTEECIRNLGLEPFLS